MVERKATPEDVRSCYRFLLGRAPDNLDVIMERINNGITQKDLVLQFLHSEEFTARFGEIVIRPDDRPSSPTDDDK